MAFDVLQRWHETKHIDTSPMHISPAVRAPKIKTSPWSAVASALGNLQSELDPVNIARRRLAMKAMPLQEAQIDAQLRLLPMQQELQRRRMQMMSKALNGQQIPGWELKPDGTGWVKTPASEIKRKQQAEDAQHNANILMDSLHKHIQDNGQVPTAPQSATPPNDTPPSDTAPGMAPSWADPNKFSAGGIPDMGGQTNIAGQRLFDDNGNPINPSIPEGI